jgi:nucleotide-binding universal stress UspA family protein
MFKRILVPIDGSTHAMKAAEMAIELARTFKADLTLLHVARKFDLPDQLKDYIKAEHLTAHDMLAIDEATKRVIADIRVSAESRGIKKIKTIFGKASPPAPSWITPARPRSMPSSWAVAGSRSSRARFWVRSPTRSPPSPTAPS